MKLTVALIMNFTYQLNRYLCVYVIGHCNALEREKKEKVSVTCFSRRDYNRRKEKEAEVTIKRKK